MIIKSIEHLISATAELLNIPEKVCRDVILSQFGWLREELSHPTHPSIMIHHLGNFYIPKAAPYSRVTQNIERLRNIDWDQEDAQQAADRYKNQIKYMWNIRHKVKDYHKSRIMPNNSRKYLVNFQEDEEDK